MKRTVSLICDKKDNPLGAWELSCSTCPLLPHLVALKMKPVSCCAGIQTSIQGPVPLKTCDHYAKNSFVVEGKAYLIECTHKP